MRRIALVLAVPSLLAAAACQSGTRTQTAAAARPAPAYTAPAPSYGAPAPTYAPAYTPAAAAPSMPAGAPRYDATNPSMAQALAGARAAGKPVAVFLLASWCGFCRKLDAGALQDASVHAEMANFYAVRVDPDTTTGREFARLARGGFPTVAILDANGAEKANWAGNRPAADLAAKLRSAR
ncbi:MAG: thioredoxin family protein [Planctomycetota bacterium]